MESGPSFSKILRAYLSKFVEKVNRLSKGVFLKTFDTTLCHDDLST